MRSMISVSMSYMSEYWKALKEHFVETMQVGDIGAEINEAIAPNILATFNLGGFKVVLSDAIVASWVVMVVIFLLGWFFGGKPAEDTQRQSPAGLGKPGQCLAQFVQILEHEL